MMSKEESRKQGLPELLAPAGNWDCARAAVENGADAIYFGLGRFNARMRAQNFTEADLGELMAFLHRRGVRGYVTLNTLLFANELARVEAQLRTLIAAGVDAVIVQDIGVCRLIRALSPDLPIHGSTQMTVTSAAGVRFARDLGCQLVVLARENSVDEIRKIQNELAAGASAGETTDQCPPSLPLEVFVHGALCVAYSGQCLTSESVGGRSANRGECAQACRMTYDLISDGEPVPLADRRYLLSPQDLAGLEVLPELTRSGVKSLKIEGRLKSPEYVANITRVYRDALDRLASEAGIAPEAKVARQGVDQEQSPFSEAELSARENAVIKEVGSESRYNLEMAFSRGLYSGWLRGIDNQKLVHGRFGTKRGVYLGEVTQVRKGRVGLKLCSPIKRGDGVVFDKGRPETKEEGGRVYDVEENEGESSEAFLSFGRDDIDLRRVEPGDRVWKTSDPELSKRLRKSFTGEKPSFRRPVRVELFGMVGKPLTLLLRDELGHVVQADSSAPLEAAVNRPLTDEQLWKQLGRLGGTPFWLADLRNALSGEVMLPVRELNDVRRRAVEALQKRRAEPKRWTLNPTAATEEAGSTARAWLGRLKQERDDAGGTGEARAPRLITLVRNLDQLETVLQCGVKTVYCDFEEPKRYREAVRRFNDWRGFQAREEGIDPAELQIFVAPARISKPGEQWILRLVRSCNADGYLVRNYDHLEYFKDARCRGDFSLNVANPLTADYLIRQYALERVTASYDLNMTQLEALLTQTPSEWLEITIHQHMPMFHMEHCVFCAFLSDGTDYTNCGRPCDHHDVRLKDRVGAEHPLKADVGCRNTVYNERAQTGSEYVQKMLALGARDFRIEFLNEGPDEIKRTVSEYQRLLTGELSGRELWKRLKLINQLGVTRGQMERNRGTDREGPF